MFVPHNQIYIHICSVFSFNLTKTTPLISLLPFLSEMFGSPHKFPSTQRILKSSKKRKKDRKNTTTLKTHYKFSFQFELFPKKNLKEKWVLGRFSSSTHWNWNSHVSSFFSISISNMDSLFTSFLIIWCFCMVCFSWGEQAGFLHYSSIESDW